MRFSLVSGKEPHSREGLYHEKVEAPSLSLVSRLVLRCYLMLIHLLMLPLFEWLASSPTQSFCP